MGDINKVSGRTAFRRHASGRPRRQGDRGRVCQVPQRGYYVDMINIFQPDILCIGGGISNETGNPAGSCAGVSWQADQYARNSSIERPWCAAPSWATMPALSAPALLGKEA